jgi:hypothetical protein
METTDSYLLLVIGVLVIALIAVELVPLPQPVTVSGPAAQTGPAYPAYKAPKLNSGAVASVLVIGTSTLATVSVT